MRTCLERLQAGTWSSEPGHHQPGHGEIDEGFTTGVRPLKIAGKPTMVRDPGIGAFYYPSSGKEMKAFGQDLVPIDGRSFWCPHPAQTGPAMFDELETNPKVLLNPLLERITRIAAIYPDDLKARQVPDQRHKQLAASLPIAEGSAGAP